METRAPMKRGQDSSKEGQEMDLPDGKTCADCAHCRRCCMMFGHIPEDEVCDWHPSRFRPVTPNAKSEPTSAALSREVGSTDGLCTEA